MDGRGSALPGDGSPEVISRSASNVRFGGMPNARWWQFEDGTVDFGNSSICARLLS
jgi:hypothetical protein